MKAVDLFAGWGGFTLGAQMAGVDVVWASNHWPLAVETHARNHPGTLHVCQDLRQADWSTLPQFDLLLASPACFGPDTTVVTERGIIAISRVSVGDRVLTHQGRWKPVTLISCRRTDTLWVGVTETTPDHRYYTRSRSSRQEGPRRDASPLSAPSWTPISRAAGMFVATPVSVELSAATPAVTRAFNYRDWYHLGRRLVSKGTHQPHAPRLGETSRPRAPGWALGLPPDCRWALLCGMLHTSIPSVVGYDTSLARTVTTTREMAVLIQLLARSLGHDAQFTYAIAMGEPVSTAHAKSTHPAPAWSPAPHVSPRIGQPDSGSFGDSGSFEDSEPAWFTVRVTNESTADACTIDGLWWSELDQQPHAARRDVLVYDLTVADDHSFVADGYVVHNRQGHSSASQPRRRAYHDAQRATAFSVIDCADVCAPRAIVVENVPSFTRWRLFDWWCEALGLLGYDLDLRLVTASRLGVPQRRQRLFVLATRPNHRVAPLAHSSSEPPIRPVLETSPTTRWVDVRTAPPGVQARINTGRGRLGARFLTQHVTGHPGVPLSEPIRTITTAPNHWNLVDGTRYRPLSGRELARAMGFPDSYHWPATATNAQVTKGLGNAVCPPVARAVIEAVCDAVA